MELLKPIKNLAQMMSSNVPENDYPEWSSATAYAVGSRVMVASVHKTYECQVAHTNFNPTLNPPANVTPRWLELGATNKFKCLDEKYGTQTQYPGPLTLTFNIGQVLDSVALLNVTGSRVEVTSTVNGVTVYTRSVPLQSSEGVTDWYQYFTAPIEAQKDVVLTDLPRYAQQTLTVKVIGGGLVSLGHIAIGSLIVLGDLQMSPTLGIISYDKKAADDFGNVQVTPRGFSKRFSARFMLPNTSVDVVASALTDVRSTPVIWMGVQGVFESLIVWGYYKDWEIDITYTNHSLCSITIEGLV